MGALTVQALLGAVQRRLWFLQFVVSLRRALWGSSALLLLAALAQLTGLSALLATRFTTPVGALQFALAALWLTLLARAAWQRPDDAACALWADRQLGGASAYTTWLETAAAPATAPHAQAVRWLQQWTEQRVPESLRVLRENRTHTRLLRPLLVSLVTSALAAVVTVLQPPAPPAAAVVAAAPAVSSPAGKSDAAPVLPQTAETAPLVTELSKALRAADSPPAAPRGAAEAGSSAAPADTRDAQAPAAAPAARPAAADPARSGPAANAAPALATAAAGAGTGTDASAGAQPDPRGGREAGSSRDQRADVGVSRPLEAPIPMQRSAVRDKAASPELQADLKRQAAYDNDAAMPRGAKASGPGTSAAATATTPAAATPPPATIELLLTTTQSSYVQAWMKASSQFR